MELQRYRIYELSARAVMSYAVEENGIYKYDLDAAAVDHCTSIVSPPILLYYNTNVRKYQWPNCKL